MSVRIGDNGNLWFKCHAGCTFADIIGALRVEAKECCMNPVNGGRAMSREVAAYDYRDEQGKLLFQAVRFEPKHFAQRQPSGSGWAWGMNGCRRVLYRLPELLANGNRAVLVVEGEKDVDRLMREGFVATCNPMGAGKWLSEYSQSLKGRNVVILPDNDKPGEEHAAAVKRSLDGVAKKAIIVSIPGTKDISDWFDAGGKAEKLREMCIAALTSKLPTAADLVALAKQMDVPDKWRVVKGLLAELENT